MLSKISQQYIEQQLEMARQSESELLAETNLARASGAIDLAHIQGQISASEYLAQHASIHKAREDWYSALANRTEMHKP